MEKMKYDEKIIVINIKKNLKSIEIYYIALVNNMNV